MNIIYLTADWLLAARNMLTMWAYTSFVSFYLACKIYFPCCASTSAPVLKLCEQLHIKVSFCICHGEHAHLFILFEASLMLYITIHIYFDIFSVLLFHSVGTVKFTCLSLFGHHISVSSKTLEMRCSSGRINSRKIFSILSWTKYFAKDTKRGMGGKMLEPDSRLFCRICPVCIDHDSEWYLEEKQTQMSGWKVEKVWLGNFRDNTVLPSDI